MNVFERKAVPIVAKNGQVFNHDLYCAKCEKLAYPCKDSWFADIKRCYVFCIACAEEYRIKLPMIFPWGAVIKDDLNSVIVDYGYGTNYGECFDKVCYFTHRGRFIKVKGKQYFLNLGEPK